MSIRLIMAGYALILFAAIAGGSAIMRGGYAGRSLRWLIAALWSAMAGLLLFAVQLYLPDFFTIVLANEAILIALVLLHQAVASILDSPRRYIALSTVLAGAMLAALLYYTYAVPDLRARILVRSAAIAIQAAASTLVLFRHQRPALLHSARFAGWTLLAFVLLQTSRLVATSISMPHLNRLQLDPVQAFYSFFNFILGLASCFAVAWLALCAKRNDLQVRATTDGLSGLMNRHTFDEVLEHELRRSERLNESVSVLLIDLDHFKEINDNYGHQMGDEVIRRVSQLLCINTRAMDAVARYGGEEFAMILKGMQLHQAESIAERLRTQIEAMAGLPEPIRVTASIGIAVMGAGDTVTSLLRRSDKALYLSKRTGRNRVSAQYAYAEY